MNRKIWSLWLCFQWVFVFSAYSQSEETFSALAEKINLKLTEKPEEATDLIKVYLEWAESSKNTEHQIKGLIFQGDYDYITENIASSTKNYLDAATLGQTKKANKYDSLICHAYAYAAFNQNQLNLWNEAITSCKKGLPFAKNLKDRSYLADYHSIMGASYFYLGEYNKSTLYFDSCLQVEKMLKDTLGMIKVINNVGKLNLDAKRWNVALRYFLDAVEMEKKGNIHPSVSCRLYGNLGDVYIGLNDFGLAEKTYKDAVRFAGEARDTSAMAGLVISQAVILRKQKRYEEALSLLEKATSLNREKDQVISFNVLLEQAQIFIYKKDYKNAEIKAEIALQKANKLGIKQKIKASLENLFEIKRRTNRPEEAMIYMDRLLAINKEINKDESDKTLLSLNAKYNYNQQLLEIEKLKNNEKVNAVEIKRLNQQKAWFVLTSTLLIILSGSWFYIFRQKQRQKIKDQEEIIRQQQRFIDDAKTLVYKQLEPSVVSGKNYTVPLEQINRNIKTPLTEREYEILTEIYQGLSNQEISEKLFLSVNTVKFHLKNIYEKLEVNNRVQAIKLITN
jgi:DNA-binding CsgD family transcriptional regulator